MGTVGAFTADVLSKLLGRGGAAIVVVTALFVTVVLAIDLDLHTSLERAHHLWTAVIRWIRTRGASGAGEFGEPAPVTIRGSGKDDEDARRHFARDDGDARQEGMEEEDEQADGEEGEEWDGAAGEAGDEEAVEVVAPPQQRASPPPAKVPRNGDGEEGDQSHETGAGLTTPVNQGSEEIDYV